MKKNILFCFFCCMAITGFSQRELWGTVSNGGQHGHGYIFKTDSIGDSLIIMHHFDSINGGNPGALLAGSDNKLYGLTSSFGQNGGLFNGGVFYEYDLSTSTFTVLQHFGPSNTNITGCFPAGDGFRTLTEITPGIIWGQIRGAYNGGVVFEYNTATQALIPVVNIPTFQGGAMNQTTGNRLEGTLYMAPDGYLYGSTYTNSACPIPNPTMGSIIRIHPVTHAFSIRYLANCSINYGYLIDNNFTTYNNELYSVAKMGGVNNSGIIYAFNPATSSYTKKYDFLGGTMGKNPSPMIAINGKFYGTADGGISEQNLPQGGGILYEFDPATNVVTKKYDFIYDNGWVMNVGPFPYSLIDGNNGKLYGVTPNGVFEYDPLLDTIRAAGRFPIMSWYAASTPSLTSVCRNPSHTLVSDTTILRCEGSSFSFDLQSDNADTYIWQQNGVTDTSLTGSMLVFNALTMANEGTWTCIMTNECGTTTSPSIEVIINNVIEPTITQNGAFLEASLAAGYQWIDCNNGDSLITGETGQVFEPATNGNYAVITVVDNCTDTSTCYSVTGLGINTPEGITSIFVSPNPVTEELRLLGDASLTIQSVWVISTTGQIVQREKSATFGVAELDAGMYFLVVETTSGTWFGNFIKKY